MGRFWVALRAELYGLSVPRGLGEDGWRAVRVEALTICKAISVANSWSLTDC
jgi:hypothetical protein